MFTDQDVIVLDKGGNETGHAGAWCDALDAVAAHVRWGEPGQVPTAPKTADEFNAAYSDAD